LRWEHTTISCVQLAVDSCANDSCQQMNGMAFHTTGPVQKHANANLIAPGESIR
jgi:hypothetical protein